MKIAQFVLAVVPALSGCFASSLFVLDDNGKRPPPIFEPGLTELEVSNRGVLVALGLSNSLGGEMEFRLLRGAEEVVAGTLRVTSDAGAGDFTRVGGIDFVNHRAHEMQRSALIETKTPLDAGDYTLDLNLTWYDEKGGHHQSHFAEPFSVEWLPSTEGGQAGLKTATLATHAAIRRGPGHGSDLYEAHRRETQSEKSEEIPDPAFWITLPTPIAQRETRVDFLFTQDGRLGGHAIGQVAVDSRLDGDPLEVPAHVWGWPKELTPEALAAHPGAWQVHVVQDGRYVTTCAIAGAAQPQAQRLDCAPATGRDVDVALAEVKGVKGYAPDAELAKQALALSRSKEVREARARVLRLARAQDIELGNAGEAAQDEDHAITMTEEKHATQRKLNARAGAAAIGPELAKARAAYKALVDKYAVSASRTSSSRR